MSERDDELLREHLQSVSETVRAFVGQIESGEYGEEWETQDEQGDWSTWTANDEQHARDQHADAFEGDDAIGSEPIDIRHIPADEPTVDETPISEYPLEIVDERGREFAVVLGTGGPHIEVVADGGCSARLEGYWGGSRATLHGDYFSTFLDYFIERG